MEIQLNEIEKIEVITRPLNDEEKLELKKLERLNKIAELKSNLQLTDYQAIKYAEGQISEAEYEPMRAQRQAWRDEINKLEMGN